MNKFLIILTLIFGYISFGQTIYEHDLDENKLSELKDNIRHLSKEPRRWTYKSEKEYKEALRKHQQQNGTGAENGSGKERGNNLQDGTETSGYESPEIERENNSSDYDPNFRIPNMSLGPLGQVVLYVVLGAILMTIVYFLFINSNFKKNGAKYVPIDIEEATPSEIPKTELQRMLEDAIGEKNYRKAIRIYYLFILKDLAEKDWIKWEKQKTNVHYVLEMQNQKEAVPFSSAVTYYEFIWYGKRKLSEDQFKNLQPHFVKLLNALNMK